MVRTPPLPTNKTVARTRIELGAIFRKWGVTHWDLVREEDDSVSVTYEIRGRDQSLVCSKYPLAKQNARAIAILIEALSLADRRGLLEELATQATALLEAPRGPRARPAHEVLGIFPDASKELAEAVYKVLAKQNHPDNGGSNEKMAELNAAIEEWRKR